MVLFSVLLIFALWIISIFSFATWRVSFICAKNDNPSPNIVNDIIFQIYLKISGVTIFIWIFMMIAES